MHGSSLTKVASSNVKLESERKREEQQWEADRAERTTKEGEWREEEVAEVGFKIKLSSLKFVGVLPNT